MKTYVPLFQERLRDHGDTEWPFWMLVGCVLVNRTRWTQAQRPFNELYLRCGGDPATLARMTPLEVYGTVRRLGLAKQRSFSLVKLARWWNAYRCSQFVREIGHAKIRLAPGCGSYAAASWAIFVEGRRVLTDDKRLREYLDHTAMG